MSTTLESNGFCEMGSGEKGNWNLPVTRLIQQRCYSNNIEMQNNNNHGPNNKVPPPRTYSKKGQRPPSRELEQSREARDAHSDAHARGKKKTWARSPFKKDLTEEGIEPNPGPPQINKPGKKKGKKAPIVHVPGYCSGCKQPGHVYKTCPNKKKPALNQGPLPPAAPGGQGQAAAALVLALANAVQDAAGAADAKIELAVVAAEEAEGEVPGPNPKKKEPDQSLEKPKTLKGVIDLSAHSFTVENVETVINHNFARIQQIFTWIGPLYALLALADWFAFPILCAYMTFTLCYRCPLASPAVTALAIFVWLGENVAVGAVIYMLTRLSNGFTDRLRYKHIYEFGTPDLTPIDTTLDCRPHPMSFGPRAYGLSTTPVTQHEVTELHWLYFDIHFELHSRVVDKFNIAGAPFAHVAASFTTYKTPSETAQEVRRLLSKAGQFDWNATNAVKDRLVENTARTLDAYKKFVGQDNYISPTNNVEVWWKKARPVLKAYIVLVWLTLLFSCLACLGAIVLSMTASASAASFTVALGRKSPLTQNRTAAPPLTHYQCWKNESPVSPLVKYTHVFGARPGDPIHQFGKLNEIAANKSLVFNVSEKIIFENELDRRPVGLFSPYGVYGIAPLLHDRSDPLTTMVGVAHRGAGKTPDGDPARMARKREIADEMLTCLIDPLASCAETISFDDMIEHLPYTIARKDELRRQHRERPGDFYKPQPRNGDKAGPNRLNGIFDKFETSAAGKTSRTIHAMSESLWDADILGSVGRYVKTAEKVIYDNFPGNIKHLNPAGVVEKLMSLGPGLKVTSDYSSYEASFTAQVKATAQFASYEHLFKNLPDGAKILGQMDWLVNSTNDFKHKFFSGAISNLKCSGDFDTAFSNWFDNMITWMTVFDSKGVHWTDAAEWVICEGDDNITDPHGLEFSTQDFSDLGMTAKLENHPDLSTAGFCQKFVNETTGTLIGDPIRFLGKKTYFDSKYAGASLGTLMSLSRATAMSALASFPSAPVISEWASRVIELTEGVTVRKGHLLSMAAYGQVLDQTTRFVKPLIQLSDRMAVSAVFNFTLQQQELFTEALKEWNGKTQLELPVSWFPTDWTQTFETYASNLPSTHASIVAPVGERLEKVWRWLNVPINADQIKVSTYGLALREKIELWNSIVAMADPVSFEAPEMDPIEDANLAPQ